MLKPSDVERISLISVSGQQRLILIIEHKKTGVSSQAGIQHQGVSYV